MLARQAETSGTVIPFLHEDVPVLCVLVWFQPMSTPHGHQNVIYELSMLILAPNSTALPQNDKKKKQADPKVDLQFLESFLFLPVFLVGQCLHKGIAFYSS